MTMGVSAAEYAAMLRTANEAGKVSTRQKPKVLWCDACDTKWTAEIIEVPDGKTMKMWHVHEGHATRLVEAA